MRTSHVAIALVLASCGGRMHEDDEEQEVERGSIPEDVVGPPKVAWKNLSHRQRATFMRKVVVPTMQPLYVAFDGKRFADFGCKTCHGADRTNHMPNPALFALPADHGELPEPWVKFMTSEVKPEMAKLLGLPETDFACTRCHPAKTK